MAPADARTQGDGIDQAAVLAWMAAHGGRLRERIAAQEGRNPTRLPADDGCVRAHLLFLADALHATAPPALAAALTGFGEGLDAWFDQERDELDSRLALADGAIALEEHLQFGVRPGTDPSLDAALERRMRLAAWTRLFALGLEAHLGPAADGLAEEVLGWIGRHQPELARMVLTLDRHAKAGLGGPPGARHPPPELLDELGQAAVVRAHVRMLVQALAETGGLRTTA